MDAIEKTQDLITCLKKPAAKMLAGFLNQLHRIALHVVVHVDIFLRYRDTAVTCKAGQHTHANAF